MKTEQKNKQISFPSNGRLFTPVENMDADELDLHNSLSSISDNLYSEYQESKSLSNSPDPFSTAEILALPQPIRRLVDLESDVKRNPSNPKLKRRLHDFIQHSSLDSILNSKQSPSN